MTDQERPSDPASQPDPGSAGEPVTPGSEATPPASEQPTIGWTAPTPPSTTPVPPSWGGASTPPPPPPTPPASDPSQPGWAAMPPPPPAPPAGGPLLSSSPAPTAGWTQPPQGGFGQQEIAPGLVFSGTAARFVAYLIDGFLLAIVSGVVSAALGVNTFGRGAAFTPGSTAFPQVEVGPNYIIATLISVVINAIYFIGFWSGGRRATLGQMLLSIQVGNAFDGKPLTTNQAVKRWFGLGEFLSAFSISAGAAAGIAGLGFLWSLVLLITTATSPTKQGLHDRFANSAVVRPIGASNAIVWGCLIIFVILPLVAIVGLIALGTQISSQLSIIGQSV